MLTSAIDSVVAESLAQGHTPLRRTAEEAKIGRMSDPKLPGRGTSQNPPNRFERLHVEPDADDAAADQDGPAPDPTIYYRDASRTILAENASPDVGFRFSLNPYRGCTHGCIYCYARPSHEYLGFSAGLDFERRIMVKDDAPELLRRTLASPRWSPEVVALSGDTDCYQPVERRLGLTRRCLEVFADFRNPVSVITKAALVTRDVDLLGALAAIGALSVAFERFSTCGPVLPVDYFYMIRNFIHRRLNAA